MKGLLLGFVLMLAIAGLIAYVGDALGRRIGRKRLTIFGLRPKNTAILFTVGTGMLIAVLTLALTLAVSGKARDRILFYNQIVSELTSKAKGAERQKQAVEADLAAAKQSLVAQTALVASEQAQATKALAARREAQVRARTAQIEARRAEERVVQMRARLAQQQARLARLQGLVHKNQATIRHQEADLKNAESDLRTAEESLKAANENAQEALARLAVSRTGQVVVPQGNEIARLPVPRGASAELILRALIDSAQQLDTRAAALGFAARKKGERGAGWHAVPVDERKSEDIDQYLKRLAAELAAQNIAVWLRATATLNTLKGEPLFYTFRQYPERVVFRKGEEIASDRFDPRRPETELVTQLRAMVQEKLRPTAEQRKMLPGLGGGPVEVPVEVWLPALRRIQSASGPVRVRIVALREIGVADPLAIEFQVTPDAGK